MVFYFIVLFVDAYVTTKIWILQINGRLWHGGKRLHLDCVVFGRGTSYLIARLNI